MKEKIPVHTKQELISLIQSTVDSTKVRSLARRDFLKISGLSQWTIDKHFDSWKDACAAAGISMAPNVTQTPRDQKYTDEQLIEELKRVAGLLSTDKLSSKQYTHYGRVSTSAISRRFGGWHNALAKANLKISTRAELELPISRDYCVSEIQCVAKKLNQDYLTAKEFNKYGSVSTFRVVRVFKSWHNALKAAGLQPSPNYKREVPIEDLSLDFLEATVNLGHIPTLVQLTRRSRYVSHTFSGRHGGYDKFKELAIEHLFSGGTRIPPAIKELLASERTHIASKCSQPLVTPITPHRQGRTLNFRAFLYSPTSEHDVEQIFGAVAHELGFEIVGNRSAFPDCESRRQVPGTRESFVKCLIEYEFASSDYKRHGHPVKGCDLVVCWVHDWTECPIEVLELKTAIQNLPGWN